MDSEAVEEKSLEAFKKLLLQPEKDRIRQIENRLNDPMIRAKETGLFLPEAISFSVLNGNRLSRVIQPVIDASLKESVRNNPKSIADAIFPALGPGIRKAISATVMGMVQSLNQLLNHSFSFQGMKWRFEAFRTGRQFAEIVLLHTLVYKVEQIFLIHNESGIVLDHVTAKDIIIHDPDLVSGMLTAIQDFVKDSFDARDDLETLRIGSDRSVWIEKGEHALIAAVIRGNPPVDLRIRFRELLEEIHIKSGMALEKFEGDASSFSVFREQLKDELGFQERKEKQKLSPLLICLILAVLSLAGIWGYHTLRSHQIWNAYLSRLKAEKGLVILSVQKEKGVYQVFGLRDPMAHDPDALIQPEEKFRIKIKGHWTPFYSLDPELILPRSRQILKPPPSITLDLSQGILLASGQASRDWIDIFQKTAPTIPGVKGYSDQGVLDMDREKLDAALKEISEIKLYFENNSTRFIKAQEDIFNKLLETVQNIQELQIKAKIQVQIMILGHTDSSGTEKWNQRLSRDRAEMVFNHLIVHGINPYFLTISGIGTKIPLKEETGAEERQYNRAVSFKVFHIPLT